MILDALELSYRVAAYIADPPPDKAAKRLVKIASQLIERYDRTEPPFDGADAPWSCTDKDPCCGNRLTYRHQIDGRTLFECPERCVCHE